jgi:hypothetical protein
MNGRAGGLSHGDISPRYWAPPCALPTVMAIGFRRNIGKEVAYMTYSNTEERIPAQSLARRAAQLSYTENIIVPGQTEEA